ncbi:MAG: hypothetical protein HXS45_10320 [Theionarchaea archaeon]|nr:hypothetical protein [Theionarchaea archaeon]
MNIRTLRKTLDRYGFDTDKALDCLLDVFVKQNVSEKGVLAADVSGPTGILHGYDLLEKGMWGKVQLLRCTGKGEQIAGDLLHEKSQEVFEQCKKLNLEGSYVVLRYLGHLLSQGKHAPSLHPEFRLAASLPVIQDLVVMIKSLLLEAGVARKAHQYTALGPVNGHGVVVTPPDLYRYFEEYYVNEERILSLEDALKDISRVLNVFRVLYVYEPKAEKIFFRKLKEYSISLEDIEGILEEMKEKGTIRYYKDPLRFVIEDKKAYKRFLREYVLPPALEEFSEKVQQSIRSNPQAYAVLSEFEEGFRGFLEQVLQKGSERWEERIPSDTLERLKVRQHDARIRKKTVYSLLHYTDFPNYLSIILYRTERVNNWDLFEPYFISIGWIKGRLIEMNEIRNDLAHPKPLEPLQYRKLQLYIDEIRERIGR